MNSPLVSIVIPFYNHAQYITECIVSVREQTYNNIEIIIVNDGSTQKESIDVLDTFRDSNVNIFHIENSGPCSAKNFGVSKAKGEIICFLDSDNIILPEYANRAVKEITENSLDWCFPDALYFGIKEGVRIQKLKCPEEVLINSPIDNCIFIRKKAFIDVGQFDEKLNRLGLEDWELSLRLVLGDFKYAYIPTPLFKYRVREDSRSANEAKTHQHEIKRYVYNKHIELLISSFSKLLFDNQKLTNSIEVKALKRIRNLLKK